MHRFALLALLFTASCAAAPKPTTLAQRIDVVAADIERDLVRIERRLAGVRERLGPIAWPAFESEWRERLAQTDQLLASARADLAAGRERDDAALISRAGEAMVRAFSLAAEADYASLSIANG
ncbi:MAG: hypothetical protein JNN27_15795 [Planctomycetes bacterium]|nr:hypothetical protein [Planctomycetota bacterium]